MGRPIIDITGQRFGRLLVLCRCKENTSYNKPQWICQCDCGKQTIVAGECLKKGLTKSCGCLAKENGQYNFKDITNQRFGKLTVLEHIGSKRKNALWRCKCDCGSIIEALGTDLRRDSIQSCGCQRSRGEEKIRRLLETNNINYKGQKLFKECKFPDTMQMARFDFYIDDKYLIEYDGKQHFYEALNDRYNLKEIQKRDYYKNQWCKKNNIPLIRIPYNAYETLSIEDLLLETTKYRVV